MRNFLPGKCAEKAKRIEQPRTKQRGKPNY